MLGHEVWPEAESFSFPGGEVGVLLLHGFTGTTYGVRPLGEYLTTEGYAVFAPRLPGHGTSLKDLASCSYLDWARCVDEGLARLQATCSRVWVAGHSMGGTLGLHLAALRPDAVAGVVTINTPVFLKDPLLPLVPMAKYVLRTFPGVGGDLRDKSQVDVCYGKVSVPAVHELMKLMRETKKLLPRVQAPLLIVSSREDHVVPPANAEYIAGHTGSSRKEMAWLENSYHMATLDFDREEVSRRCVAFIQANGTSV